MHCTAGFLLTLLKKFPIMCSHSPTLRMRLIIIVIFFLFRVLCPGNCFLWCVLFVISISWRFVPQLHIISSSGRGKRCIRHMHSRHVRSTLRILPYRRGCRYLWIDSFCIRGYVYASRFGCSPVSYLSCASLELSI